MTSLNKRNLDRKIYEKLRVLTEGEARLITCQGEAIPEKLSDIFLKHFGPDNGVDLDL